MDSTAVESINNNNNDINKLEQVEDSYEDDFEKDLDSEGSSKNVSSPRKDDDQDVIAPSTQRQESPTELEKGQQEVETPGKERALDEPSDNDSEPDADAYNFTEDQKRAMMELMVQKQEDVDLLDEEPPEYNVKGRLEQLNAELANEPSPVEGDREHRVGFKAEIVDLVAPPPPDFSDDESQPNSARGDIQPADSKPASTFHSSNSSNSSSSNNDDKDSNKENAEDPNKKQYVVERDGNFSVLSANELTSSERAMLIKEEPAQQKTTKQSENQRTKDKTYASGGNEYNQWSRSSGSNTSHVVPKPPARPRPNTAATGPRRNVRPASSPRPRSAGQTSNSNTLDDFNYNSPYAMTPELREEAREEARRREEERREKERKKKEDDEERKRDNDSAFQAWLYKKREESKKKHQNEDGKQQSEQERSEQDEPKAVTQKENPKAKEPDPDPEKEESEEAYKTWLKEKRTQGKKEKLLKRRQQQEQMEGYFLRPREECEKAYKEWLKKKNADFKKQQTMERQRNRMYRVQVKRSKKTQALVKALKESQAFRYVDYYGYRY